MKKMLIALLEQNNEEIKRLCKIIAENFKEFGLGYNRTTEYACLILDFEIRRIKQEIYTKLLKLWDLRK